MECYLWVNQVLVVLLKVLKGSSNLLDPAPKDPGDSEGDGSYPKIGIAWLLQTSLLGGLLGL